METTAAAIPHKADKMQSGTAALERAGLRWILEETPSRHWGEIDRRNRKGHGEMHLPPWMADATEWTCITPERFREVRKFMLQLKVVQCAALLRVSSTTVWRWESGALPVPFAAYMALRLLLDVRYLPHQVKAWDGWKIINAGPDVGKLYDSKNTGEMFSPPEIRAVRWVKGERDAWQRRAEKAEARAAELEAENTRLRQLFNAQGVTTELRQMQDKLAAMLDTIGTAEIIDYKPAAAAQRLEKAA